MNFLYTLNTQKENMYDITSQVNDALSRSDVQEGICVIYTPHTTCAITINENADPDVVKDLLFGLNANFGNRKEFLHNEGNSSAHLKSSVVGASETVIVNDGKLVLGTWQSIFFCEFDGPRERKFYVKLIRG